jgi:hypothetical protein
MVYRPLKKSPGLSFTPAPTICDPFTDQLVREQEAVVGDVLLPQFERWLSVLADCVLEHN